MRRNKVNGVIANNIYIDADRMSDANIGNLAKETMMIYDDDILSGITLYCAHEWNWSTMLQNS